MNKKEKVLNYIRLTAGILTILASIVTTVIFISKATSSLGDSDTTVFGFAFLFLFLYSTVPLMFAVIGVSEVISFFKAIKGKKSDKKQFIMEIEILCLAVICGYTTRVGKEVNLIVPSVLSIICIIFRSFDLITNENNEKSTIEKKLETEDLKGKNIPKLFCSQCGAKLNDDVKFCPYCGKEQ